MKSFGTLTFIYLRQLQIYYYWIAMDFEPTLSPRFAVYIQNYLLDMNISAQDVFNRCNISYPSTNEQEMAIPLSNMACLMETIAWQSRNPYLGLHLAQQYHYESSGTLILAVLAASNVEEGMKALCHYDRYVDTALETSLDIGPEISSFNVAVINPKNVPITQLAEFLIILTVDILKKGTRKKMPVTEVWFSHSDNKSSAPLEKFLGAPVKYNQTENKVFFTSSFLKKRFVTSNDLLFDILTNSLKNYLNTYEQDSSFLGMVCREIIRQTTDTAPNIHMVSSSMGMSERTLRRHLSNEGLSFQEVKNMARKKRAQYYLANSSLSLTDIAFELGFSELSAFSRAFRHWVGETPQAYRNKLKTL